MKDKPIIDIVGEKAVLLQIMEECGELIAACSKVIRKRESTSPTPMTEDEVRKNLLEEIADVTLCIEKYTEQSVSIRYMVSSIMLEKNERWYNRLEGRNE